MIIVWFLSEYILHVNWWGNILLKKKKKTTVVSVWWLPFSYWINSSWRKKTIKSEAVKFTLLFKTHTNGVGVIIVECTKTSCGACTTSQDSMVQHVLARVCFESHVVSTFRQHLRVLLHLTDNIKLSNTRRQHKCIYIKHRSPVINATHCVLTGENIGEADVASLPRVTL